MWVPILKERDRGAVVSLKWDRWICNILARSRQLICLWSDTLAHVWNIIDYILLRLWKLLRMTGIVKKKKLVSCPVAGSPDGHWRPQHRHGSSLFSQLLAQCYKRKDIPYVSGHLIWLGVQFTLSQFWFFTPLHSLLCPNRSIVSIATVSNMTKVLFIILWHQGFLTCQSLSVHLMGVSFTLQMSCPLPGPGKGMRAFLSLCSLETG